jgi:pimeloyl-ACP methyl ester carboxylesterase
LSARDATDPPFNCFYVYPTVVGGSELNAPLEVQPVIRQTAIEQASQFSRVCQVWAPVYRQATLRGLVASIRPGSPVARTAYDSLLAAWREFLARDDGKPIVVIGHSQGAAILIQLLRQEVDQDPAVRSLLVSAILLGGNVQVPTGRAVGGTFKHLPLCTAPGQAGCVIAYSSFDAAPPPDSYFGIPGRGVSLLSGQSSAAGQQVACVNPAAIGGGAAPLQPYFASVNAAGTTASWVTYPRLYTAACETAGNTTWLQVTDVAGPADHRPVVHDPDSAAFGLHRYDVNLALGNLVQDVQAQEAAYRSRH